MIRLTCNRCNAALEIDDAFAGSTCRCQHCGTIQTVPAAPAAGKRPKSPTSATSRTLYAESRRGAGGSGLDQLAEVVSSSSGLRQAKSAKPTSPPTATRVSSVLDAGPRSQNRTTMMILIGAVVGIAIGGTAVVMMTKSAPAPSAAPPVVTSGVAPSAPAGVAVAPSFCGVELNDSPVIYLIDRGSSSRESLGYVVAATLASARTLGRDRKFQVMMWENTLEPITYPPNSPGYATPETIAAAGRALEQATPFGRSDAVPVVRRAVAMNPAAIVLITAKGWELDDTFVQSILLARGSSGCKVHAISIGGAESGEALEKLAKATNGSFRAVSVGDLKVFARTD